MSFELLILVFFALGAISFAASTLFGGGGAMLALPVASLLAPNLAAPILNLGALVARPVRLVIFWRFIDWRVVAWYAPAASMGALIAGFAFASSSQTALKVLVAIFLLVNGFELIWSNVRSRQLRSADRPANSESGQSVSSSYKGGESATGQRLPRWAFAPAGLVVSVISTLIGAVGPVLNPLYVKTDVNKEAMIATKTACSLVMGVAQIGAYAVFVKADTWVWLGLAFGVGAGVGSWVSKGWVLGMSSERFTGLVGGFMALSGLGMLWTLLV
jgi:uncharacterized membrane protein YfcA